MTTDEDCLGKLHILHELINKHQVVKDIHPRILAVYKELQSENKFVEQCTTEKRLLEEERQVHVETIRQINKDLEDVTAVEKRSEENRRNLTKSLTDLLEEYLPVKDHVDRLRGSLELEKLPDLSEDGVQIPPSLLVKLDHPHIPLPSNSDLCAFHPVYNQIHQSHPTLSNSMGHPPGLSICDSPAFRQKPPPMKAGSSPFPRAHSGLRPNEEHFWNFHKRRRAVSQHANADWSRATVKRTERNCEKAKKCPTCANDIHRNAPICPICKSKSHSKNPKKSKKKTGN